MVRPVERCNAPGLHSSTTLHTFTKACTLGQGSKYSFSRTARVHVIALAPVHKRPAAAGPVGNHVPIAVRFQPLNGPAVTGADGAGLDVELDGGFGQSVTVRSCC